MGTASSRNAPMGAKKRIFLIEGNIAAGKTELLKGLSDKNYTVVTEPVQEWTTTYVDDKGKNILELFYVDMEKHSFKMQIVSLITRWKLIQEAIESKDEIVIIERSIFTDRYSFALNLYEQGQMSTLEWKIYTDLLEDHASQAEDFPSNVEMCYVYVRTDPEVCLERKDKRGRPEEKSVTLDYLKTLHDKNESWLCDPEFPQKVVVLNGNQDEASVLSDMLKVVTSD